MIYCVEDDASIRDIEVYALGSAGFEAKGFADGAALLEALGSGALPTLILLDVMLPGEDGVALLRRIKGSERTHAVPVIMATAKGAEYDKVQSLDLGADDYLVKPFGVMELIARVKAVLRRCQGEEQAPVLGTGGLALRQDAHTVSVDGVRVQLTYKEYELLRLFLAHPGRTYTREQLFASVWGMDYCVETRTVDMHIWTLRQKLGAYGKRIETVRGVGYRWEENP